MRTNWLIILLIFLLSSCINMRLQGPYRSHYPDMAEGFKNDESQQELKTFQTYADDLDYWWQIFDDPILNALELAAIENNYNLEAALQRIYQARALAWGNFGAMFPQINFNPGVTASGGLSPYNNIFGSTSNTVPRFILHQYSIPLNLSYEVDVWGRLAQTYNAAVFTAQAAEEDYLNIWLQITSDVATNYYTIRGFDSSIEVLQRTIRSRQEALEVNKSRYKAGLIYYNDVSRAEVELASAKAQEKDAIRQRILQENILSLLVGKSASLFCVNTRPLSMDTDPVVVPPGLPSSLLLRRPDIATAERKMASSYESLGVAYTSFFPAITLTNTVGFFSPVANLLGTWQSRNWNIGAAALQSVFDGGQNYANLYNAKAILSEAMALYEQQILQGFKDVEDSLANIYNYAKIQVDLKEAVSSSRITLELSKDRYMQGLITYLDVTTAERDLLTAELTLITNQQERFLASILLIKALGGGWDNPSIMSEAVCE